MKEALLYKKFPARGGFASDKKEKQVQCQACNHYCVIRDGNRGICGVRENRGGKLYSLVYGKVIAKHVDPIEKKPFFHFLPGSQSLSVATIGCNFRCLYCQNADIAQASKEGYFFEKKEILGEDLTPKEIVSEALSLNLPSISYTYTEPTIFIEFALETMKLARKNGLKNTWVTNGYTSTEGLKLALPYLDAANVDLKGFSEEFYNKICGARLKPVLETLKAMKKAGAWVEITTLVVPGQNNTKEHFEGIANFIAKVLGKETPWHISRFFPTYKLMDTPPTSLETLETAYNIGKKSGLKYVYLGNVAGEKREDTFCPKCGEKMIDRTGYDVLRYDKDGKCAKCGQDLNLIL
jgi:pyruvate formate lyase activating enzyme